MCFAATIDTSIYLFSITDMISAVCGVISFSLFIFYFKFFTLWLSIKMVEITLLKDVVVCLLIDVVPLLEAEFLLS